VEPVETFNSAVAATRNWAPSPLISATCSMPSSVERTPASLFNAVRTRRLAKKISIDLASHSDDRSEDKADQYRLHHRIGVEIHAPGAEIARQGGSRHDIVLRERRQRSGKPRDQRCARHPTASQRSTERPIFPVCLSQSFISIMPEIFCSSYARVSEV
jgi:hypothetical protein